MTQTKNGTIQPSVNYTTYSYGWSHIALVQNKETSSGWGQQTTTYKLLLFKDGKQVASEDYKANNTSITPTINTLDEALVIGANISGGLYFKGLIDSVKISGTAKYTAEFTPAKLTADGEDTVAFWDFSGNADDSSENGLDGTATDVTYSTDCAF